ncbi:MAG TPA: 5-formyltetrahydrofolate cyclo-ligase [Candidatus Thermoplasmatota archaeon]|nr:5-formyltetrahydrofolate cyclo-ligase [Candidatus Thermoplasmatota archaeon]
MDKSRQRDEARAIRRSIAPTERAALSARIADHVLSLPEVAQARRVGCYVGVRSEVDTTLLLRALLVKGALVAVPVTLGDRLQFVRLDHPWTLAPGAHGIPEPRQPWSEVRGDDLQVVIVPGVRFGRDGSRLGNGGGHFDRFLAEHPMPLRIGLAFSQQVVESVATEGHDQGMDVLVTEEGRVRAERKQE